jgi:hypothetical protein
VWQKRSHRITAPDDADAGAVGLEHVGHAQDYDAEYYLSPLADRGRPPASSWEDGCF